MFLLLFALPQAGMLASSVTQPSWTLAHYARIARDPYWWSVFGRSLLLGGGVVLVTLVLGAPLAYRLARSPSRWAPLVLLLTTFPLWVSAVVRAFGWVVLLARGGVVSQALMALGVPRGASQLLYTLGGVLLALAQVLLPFMVLTLYGVFRSIDPDLERAAQNLGASPGAALRLVTLPLARQGIAAGCLLVLALAVGAFATPSLVGGARAQVAATAIYEQTLELLDWPFAAALSTVLLVLVLAVALLQARLAPAPVAAR